MVHLAAVQIQNLALWAESLKAGGSRFLYRSLTALNTETDSDLVFWRPPAGRCTFEGGFHPTYCGVRGYRILPPGKLDGVYILNL